MPFCWHNNIFADTFPWNNGSAPCANLNREFFLNAVYLGLGSGSLCRWICQTTGAYADLNYYSAGDYWELRFSPDNGAHYIAYRLAGASWVCDGPNTLTLFGGSSVCGSVPASVDLSDGGPIAPLLCGGRVCPYDVMPNVLHATFMGPDCSALTGKTVTLTKLGNGSDWDGSLMLDNGDCLCVTLDGKNDPFGQGCPDYTLEFGLTSPGTDPCCPGDCNVTSVLPEAQCELTSCSPPNIYFPVVPLSQSDTKCPDCLAPGTVLVNQSVLVTA